MPGNVAQEEFKDKKTSIKDWFTKKFIPKVAKIGNQRHIAAIRDSFGTMIPIIIAGSIGILIGTIGFGGWGSGYVSILGLLCKASNSHTAWSDISTMLASTNNNWGKISTIFSSIFNVMNTATIGMMSIYFIFLFGYYLALGKKNKQPIIGGFVALASFVIACMGQITFFMGAQGLIAAIVFGIISSELYVRFCNVEKFNLKLPDSVPPAVGKSFQVFLPAFFALACVAVLNLVVLMPAILIPSSHLYVTGMSYDTVSNGLLFDQTMWDKAFPDGNLWSQQNANLLNELFTRFSDTASYTDGHSFKEWLDTLSPSQNAFVATALANYDGKIDLSTLTSILDHAKINAVWNSSLNNWILSINWNDIKIGSTSFGLGEAIYQFFTMWFISFATSNGGLALAVLFAFFVSFFWFFGIHGSNIMGGIFEPIWTMIVVLNSTLVTSMGSYDAAVATGSMGVFGKPFFDSFMYVGGSGATLGLLIATFIFSKRRDLKEIAKYATPPGIFQINEPTIFGYPIILNPVYFAPFILAPIANLMTAYIFSPAVLNWMHYPYIIIPWTTPWFLGGILSTLSPGALIPTILVIFIDIFIYLPFVLIDNRKFFKRIKNENVEMYHEELKYSFNKYYHFVANTKKKYQAKLNAADHAVTVAENRNDFIKSLTFKEARKTRMINKNLTKANERKTQLIKKAEEFKSKRDKTEMNLKNKLLKANLQLSEKLKKQNTKIQTRINQKPSYMKKGELKLQFNNDIIASLA